MSYARRPSDDMTELRLTALGRKDAMVILAAMSGAVAAMTANRQNKKAPVTEPGLVRS
jgi:hypothetical protein